MSKISQTFLVEMAWELDKGSLICTFIFMTVNIGRLLPERLDIHIQLGLVTSALILSLISLFLDYLGGSFSYGNLSYIALLVLAIVIIANRYWLYPSLMFQHGSG